MPQPLLELVVDHPPSSPDHAQVARADQSHGLSVHRLGLGPRRAAAPGMVEPSAEDHGLEQDRRPAPQMILIESEEHGRDFDHDDHGLVDAGLGPQRFELDRLSVDEGVVAEFLDDVVVVVGHQLLPDQQRELNAGIGAVPVQEVRLLRPVRKNGSLRRGERAFYFLRLQCGASHVAAVRPA